MNNEAMDQSFKELQAHWYKKLKDEVDFDDIEYPNGELKQIHDRTKRRAAVDQVKREGYFDAAWAFYHKNEFDDQRSKIIWGLHCEGETVRFIANRLQIHWTTVQYNIRQLRIKAKLTR